MNQSIDFASTVIAVPFCIALILVLVAALIAGSILRVLRFCGVISGRLLDEAEAFRASRPRKMPGKTR